MNAVVYSPVRNEKGPAKGLFPQASDLHNIVVIVNYWKSKKEKRNHEKVF